MGKLVIFLTRIIFIFGLLQIFGCFEHFSALNYLATKTPYKEPQLNNIKVAGLEQCKVIHINHLGRHGSRYQANLHSIEHLDSVIKQAEKEHALTFTHGKKIQKLVANMLNIQNSTSVGQLTEQGKEELRGIASRMYNNFSDLFAKSDINRPIILEHTYIKRTKDSMLAFLEKLITYQENLRDRARISTDERDQCDSHLRFFDTCNAYIDYKRERPYTTLVDKAIWKPTARQEIKNILNRIFSPQFVNNLTPHEQKKVARNIYGLCQLDADIDKRNLDDFCSFFSNAREMEYFNWEDDALSYFSKGYGGEPNHIAHRSACSLVNDFITTTDRALTNKEAPIANLRFAHAETVIPFVVQLGLYREDSSTDILMSPNNRKFRTANVSPMAANVQWILYKCPNNDYRMRMILNENDISFPILGCENKKWCSWQKIKDYLINQRRSCSKEEWAHEICEGTSCTKKLQNAGTMSTSPSEFRN